MYSQETSPVTRAAEEAIVATELDLTTEFDKARLSFSDEGWSSRVYLLDDGEIVYKFPRSPGVINDYQREIAALRLLGASNPPVPVQRYRSSGPDGAYFSYHGIVGTQLSEQLDVLNAQRKQHVGAQIGSFLHHLHRLELPGVPLTTPDDEVQEYQAKYRLAVPTIAGELTASEQTLAANFFHEELPAEVARLGADIRLCHGDLGSYNIVINAEGRPGIIDFGNIGYYDNSKDFIDFGDETVLNAVLDSYGETPWLREKIAVRTIALQAIDIVYYLHKRDGLNVQKTVAKLRSLLTNRSDP